MMPASCTTAHIPRELNAFGAGKAGRTANDLFTLDRPHLDWVAMARGHGVDAGRATTLDELGQQLLRGYALDGPYLVDLVC